MFVLILFNGLAPEHSRGPNVSAHIQVAAGICIRLVLRRHDRDPNVSTHIRIAAVLWDQTIKSLCVFVLMFVLSFLMLWSQGTAAIRM